MKIIHMDVTNSNAGGVILQSAMTITKEEIYKKKPEELTMLLYQALEDNLADAIAGLEQQKYVLVNDKLKRANDIVERLGAGINYEAGIIADQLHVLYEYLAEKLIEANIKKDISICKEIYAIVKRISEGWEIAMEAMQSGQCMKRKKLGYDEQVDFLPNIDKRFDLKN